MGVLLLPILPILPVGCIYYKAVYRLFIVMSYIYNKSIKVYIQYNTIKERNKEMRRVFIVQLEVPACFSVYSIIPTDLFHMKSRRLEIEWADTLGLTVYIQYKAVYSEVISRRKSNKEYRESRPFLFSVESRCLDTEWADDPCSLLLSLVIVMSYIQYKALVYIQYQRIKECQGYAPVLCLVVIYSIRR